MFRLCLGVGWPHPDFLGEVLSMRQVADWAWFYGAEPWGYEADDMRNALQAFVTARSAGAKDAKIEMFRLRMKGDGAEGEPVSLADQVRAAFKLPRREEG